MKSAEEITKALRCISDENAPCTRCSYYSVMTPEAIAETCKTFGRKQEDFPYDFFEECNNEAIFRDAADMIDRLCGKEPLL